MSAAIAKRDIRRSFGAAAAGYDSVAALQRRIGAELLARFDVSPAAGAIADLGCGTGFLTGLLLGRAADRPVYALDIALPMLQAARAKWPAGVRYVCADAERLPLADAGLGQIYSNLALQWCADLPALFGDCRRVLAPGGQLAFATFGPGTLVELKAAWAEVDDYRHVNAFVSGAEIRDQLAAAGWHDGDIVSRTYSTEYAAVADLMRELKGIGAHNLNADRKRGPTTRLQLRDMIAAYQALMPDARIVASWEILFVRAFR